MNCDNSPNTIHLIVGNELFELSISLYGELLANSSSANINIFKLDNQNQSQIHINVDPCIFNAYLFYIQSGCFIPPDYLSQQDLINGLRICGASSILINYYEHCDLTSILSSHEYSCHIMYKNKRNQQTWFYSFILSGLFIAGCCLTIDLYRQMLVFNKSFSKETSKWLTIMIYFIDAILFLYSSLDGISKVIMNISKGKKLTKDPYFITNMISCLGILCYFTTQRPITHVDLLNWNSFWKVIHMCRAIRIAQLGYHLIGIHWCLYAITECFWIFLQIVSGTLWILIFSGSILFTVDMIENNDQYTSNRQTILSSHETLYTIGYRNAAPYGFLTRFWTIISIYFMSSIIQLFLWWFQTKVTTRWKILLKSEK